MTGVPSFERELRHTSMKAAVLLALACAAAAQAQSPPVDPWVDTAWQDVLFGLVPGKVARVHATQQLLDGQSGVLSTRTLQLEFQAPGGRLSRLVVDEERRGESRRHRAFRYLYEDGLLQRIDEDGHATPAVTRRHDSAGRPIEHTERSGAVVARTTWRRDDAGRVLERTVDSGTGQRTRETRRYRRDGTLERLQVDGGTMSGKVVEFDGGERPLRIRVTDLLDRHETNVSYPTPTEAIHATTGFAATRDRTGRYRVTTRFRVRTPQELRGVEAPELPTLRSRSDGTRHDETQTDYDARGRIVVERQVDGGGNVLCTARFEYHPSGPPLAVRHERTRPDAACAVQGGDIENDIRSDAQGQWVEQRMTLLGPDGRRRPMSVQTRRIETLP